MKELYEFCQALLIAMALTIGAISLGLIVLVISVYSMILLGHIL